jgi:hypothetical protein
MHQEEETTQKSLHKLYVLLDMLLIPEQLLRIAEELAAESWALTNLAK